MSTKLAVEDAKRKYVEATTNTILPEWVVLGIRKWAHEQTGPQGEEVYHKIATDWINAFEALQRAERRQ